MRESRYMYVVALSAAGMLGTAQAIPTYSGSLSYDGGGIAGIDANPWLAGGTVFSWGIEDNGNGTFTYTYRLQVPDGSKEISHMTVEVSPEFDSDDILEVHQGSVDGDQPNTYPVNGSDPGMPSPMWGIKFQGGGAGGTNYDWTVSFTTGRAPVWGDFYAKNGTSSGEWVAIWNQGFTNPDSDPADPPGNTPIGNHILVPDTTTYIPAPGAGLLAGFGVVMVSRLRGRRRL